MKTTAEILRSLPYFSDLDDELLDDVCRKSQQLTLPDGTRIIEEGTLSEEMYVIVSGRLEVSKKSSNRDVVLAELGPGDVVGEIALLDGAPRTASVVTLVESEVVRIPGAAFEELIGDSRVVRRMFRTVTSRLRGIEETLRHEERMAALGRMAAQLMHELNNPAAAVGRSSRILTDVYRQLGDAAVELADSGSEFRGRIIEPTKPDGIDAVTRSEREEATAAWLEKNGLQEEAWELAPAFTLDGWTTADLDEAAKGLDPETVTALARWIGLRALASQLLGEVSIGAKRISELVRIVKDYSYLDQAPVQEINPTDGIADTLVLLKHKLTGIEVVTDYEPDLPKIEAPGRDLNQVWTNLIDNAADAMEGGGVLTIRARKDTGHVVVEVADTGSGMDPETAERIFDPFFTTKEPGKGTGLGLHTVHTIINRIGGEISVTSSPQGTTFAMRFPVASAQPELG